MLLRLDYSRNVRPGGPLRQPLGLDWLGLSRGSADSAAARDHSFGAFHAMDVERPLAGRQPRHLGWVLEREPPSVD